MVHKVKFFDIMDNPDYYEITDDGKDFFVCATDGFIPKSQIDMQSKYGDIHCMCGDPVIRATFSNEELRFIENDRIQASFVRMCEEAML